MQLTRNSIETARGPSDWFTGAVHIDAVGGPLGGLTPERESASTSRPAPGRRGTPIPTARPST